MRQKKHEEQHTADCEDGDGGPVSPPTLSGPLALAALRLTEHPLSAVSVWSQRVLRRTSLYFFPPRGLPALGLAPAGSKGGR